MATGVVAPLPQRIETNTLLIENADGTTAQTLLTVATGKPGKTIEAINVTTDDTVAPTVIFSIAKAAGDEVDIAAITLAAEAGTDGATASVNALESLADAWNARSPLMGADHTLKVRVAATLTAAKNVGIYIEAWDYDDGV